MDGKEREREIDPIHWFPSQISRVAGAGSTKAGSWTLETPSNSFPWVKGIQ